MSKKFNLILISLLLYNLISIKSVLSSGKQRARLLVDSRDDFDDVDITVAQALRARGYLADEYQFKTTDGYVLSIVCGSNPLIKKELGDPIIFLHGANSSPVFWLINSARVKPKDFPEQRTDDNVEFESQEDLFKYVGTDPSAKALPFLAMNFGHKVWILSRRGYPMSENKEGDHLNRSVAAILDDIPITLLNEVYTNVTNVIIDIVLKESETFLSPIIHSIAQFLNPFEVKTLEDYALSNEQAFQHTFDRDYWHFSLDQQVDYDLPKAIEFVLSKSKRKQVILVGHSTGGAIIMLALSQMPKYYDEIVSKAILWAPAVNLGSEEGNVNRLSVLKQIIEPHYIGPMPLPIVIKPMKELLISICTKSRLARKNICMRALELMGETDRYSTYKKFTYSVFPESACVLELAHLVQNLGEDQPKRYDYQTVEENLAAHGSETPPIYNLSLITHKSIFMSTGNTDKFVCPDDLEITSSQLTVPHLMQIIGKPGVNFNHAAYFLHDLTPELAIVPSMWFILS